MAKTKETTTENALPQTIEAAITGTYESIEAACKCCGVDYESEGDVWVDSVTFKRTAAGWVTEVNGTRK